jgi:hypothetical protein
MFDYVNRKRDPISLIFYGGLIPFGLIWALHQSLVTAFVLEVYLITTCVFVIGPFEVRKQRVNQPSFWKAMLRAGAVIHPIFLATVWYLDATHPAFVAGVGTLFFVAFLVSIVEAVVLETTVDHFRPED